MGADILFPHLPAEITQDNICFPYHLVSAFLIYVPVIGFSPITFISSDMALLLLLITVSIFVNISQTAAFIKEFQDIFRAISFLSHSSGSVL